jgi:hypothetical protein
MATTTLFDLLPTELIYMIFNYLSSNDIIYTFFFLSQRLNNLLLHNQHYLTYLESPRINFYTWESILSIIGSQIECLNITTNYLSFSLKYFPNIRSIIISSPFGLPDEELKSIIESELFQNLHSFEIIEEKILSDKSYNNTVSDKDYLFKRIFDHKNSLEILTIPSFCIKTIDNLNVNFNLHSMTLNIINFENIFLLIESAPNLEYLNVETDIPQENQHQIWINVSNIKLKQLYSTLHSISDASNKMNRLNHCIKQFSSSLICLSLNLTHLVMKNVNEIPFNSIKLQQFLEPMKKLKEFHLHAKLDQTFIISHQILPGFENQYWFDHNWSFGVHDKYLYTLPFHFDYLYRFSESFDYVKSSNPEILINNPRIWYRVKSIELEKSTYYHRNLIKQLKIKMPKLNLIKFSCYLGASETYLFEINNERNKIDLRLDNVMTIQFTRGFIENIKHLIISSLPNLRHLILSSGYLPSIDNQLSSILNERIQRLDIDIYSKLET